MDFHLFLESKWKNRETGNKEGTFFHPFTHFEHFAWTIFPWTIWKLAEEIMGQRFIYWRTQNKLQDSGIVW